MRQSAAQSRHQLLPARGARGACKWRVSAGSRCTDVAHSSPASASSVCDLEPRLGNQQRPSRHERPPTQTRPFGSVSALVAAVFGPAVGSAAPMSVAVNGADLQLHWQYVRRSRVHGNQRSCTCGLSAHSRSAPSSNQRSCVLGVGGSECSGLAAAHRTIWSEVKDMMGHGESDVHSVESSHSKAGDA